MILNDQEEATQGKSWGSGGAELGWESILQKNCHIYL